MQDNTQKFGSQDRTRFALKQALDIDFIRSKFKLSSKDVEKAIRHAGNSRLKIIEHLRQVFNNK